MRSESDPPALAVIMPVYRPSPALLRQAIMSVRQQTVDDWELVVVDDASGSRDVDDVLRWAAEDDRITVVELDENRGISAASNVALDLVTAPWLALLDHDDFLEPAAFEEVLRAVADNPEAVIIYSDRDSVDLMGVPTGVFRKPDWSPQRLLGNMYLAHLTCLRTATVREVGGFRPAFDGAQDHDLALRVADHGGPAVVHIPRVLYHWRESPGSTALDPGAKPYATDSGLRAAQEHLDRRGVRGIVRSTGFAGFYYCDLVPDVCLVSIVIPTQGSVTRVRGAERVMVIEAVNSILRHEYTVDYEIVVVHDETADDGYLSDLQALAAERLRIVRFSGPFNFSAKVNAGVEESSGEVVIVLNDDVEVVTSRWMDQLVALAQQEGVGAVGAKLLFEDGRIQHVGHAFAQGHITHVSAGDPDGPGEFGANLIDREVVGVTAACLAQKREVWVRLGGFDESLPNNFNDVDYCLRIRAKGYRIIQANSVTLFHYESRTRIRDVRWWEASRILDRMGPAIHDDPYTPDRPGLQRPSVVESERDAREWVRLTGEVIRSEGFGALARKAARRMARRPRVITEGSGHK